MLGLAWKSLLNRRLTAALAVLSIAMSVALILTVEKVRHDARESFARTVSGTDLVVGARSGQVQLLLYSVFRVGDATSDVSWESAEWIRSRPRVAWTVPLSLGDAYRGRRVLGTTLEYFERYRHGEDRPLAFAEGRAFDDVFDAVLGSAVAAELDHGLGDEIVVAHGTGSVAIVEHENAPFRIVGILAPTGTPVDDTVHVSLEGIEAMHVDWRGGMAAPGPGTPAEVVRQMDLAPSRVTALLVGLASRGAIFSEQRAINEYREEPLLAILPGVALQQLWSLVGVAAGALLAVSALVVLAGLVNLVSVLFAGLEERRREMAILRANGASPGNVFGLLCLESALLSLAGIAAGLALHWLAVAAAGLWVGPRFGLDLVPGLPGPRELALLGAVLVAGTVAGCLPAFGAFRRSLADGMAQRF